MPLQYILSLNLTPFKLIAWEYTTSSFEILNFEYGNNTNDELTKLGITGFIIYYFIVGIIISGVEETIDFIFAQI